MWVSRLVGQIREADNVAPLSCDGASECRLRTIVKVRFAVAGRWAQASRCHSLDMGQSCSGHLQAKWDELPCCGAPAQPCRHFPHLFPMHSANATLPRNRPIIRSRTYASHSIMDERFSYHIYADGALNMDSERLKESKRCCVVKMHHGLLSSQSSPTKH